jgi:hypothetical protein
LIFELGRVDADAFVIFSREGAVLRCAKMIGALRSADPQAIDDELVALGFSAEYRMILQDQAAQFGIALLESQGRREAADAATHHHAIERFTGIGLLVRTGSEDIIPNLVAGTDNLVGVAVGSGIIAHPRISGPFFFGDQLSGSEGAEQGAARSQQSGIHEIAAENGAVHA